MNRRDFISYIGIGSAVSALPVVTSSCTPQATDQVSHEHRADGFQVVGTLAELEKKQQLLVENLADQKVLIFLDPSVPQKVIALNPTCPHAGCAVTWQQQESSLICPCHDSKFSPSG
jgi:cytochrome b6-f complex iron-sulfur subunit